MPGKRILIIEDEQVVALDLRNLLKRLGHTPLGPAVTAGDAIRLAAETLPDLILMDVKLEGEHDGVHAATEITRHRLVPIVYITAYPEKFISGSSPMVHPFLCVAKPFSFATVEAAIRSALHLSELRPN